VTGLATLAFVLAGIHVGALNVVPGAGTAPAWSPNAERIAYTSRGGIWIADADGSHRTLLVRRAADPAWSPSGTRLAFTRGGSVWTIRADGVGERRLARGGHAAWSANGARIAFDRGGVTYVVSSSGGTARAFTHGVTPAYSGDGRLAVVDDGTVRVGTAIYGTGNDPTWSPDGRDLAYESDGTIYVGGIAVARGRQPAWRPEPGPRELLPDFDQRAPEGVVVAGGPGHWRLGFTSLVDNVGLGPAIVEGVRASGAGRMIATQHVRLANGGRRRYRDVGRLRYTNSAPHFHWHYMRFDAFELRSLDGRTLVRDRKSGFCLADHYGIAPGYWPFRSVHFLGNCAQRRPHATHVLQGTSLGFTDRYPAFFHGQNVDITSVPAGVYVLVHRVNENLLLRELRYENDAASVRLRLTWRIGRPSVRILRRCGGTATCGPTPARDL
jgi:hypothetical protein